jgi:hypothetical protein
MGYVSNHHKTEKSEARCTLCGVKVVRDSDAAKIVCLICQAAILNRMFQVQRQEMRAEKGLPTFRLRWST